MKRKILNILVIILTISTIFELYVYINNSNKSNKVLDNIKINNKNFNDKKQMISIQIQNDDDYDYHEAEDKTKWPDKSIYTYAGSTCINKDGTEINASGIISFDELEYTAEIQTKQTVYCTLYFTKGKPALNHLKAKGGNKFNSSSAVFGLYRFKGTKYDVTNHNLNNYICFGTTDIATCTGSEKQTYMYRIIGITDRSETNTTLELEENQLKIIRAYPSNLSQQWHNSATDQRWDVAEPGEQTDAVITEYLNETFLTTEKAKWKNTYWEGIIDEPYWYTGDNTNAESTTETITKSNRTHKVGLVYKSDYVNSGPSSLNDLTNWLFIANGMTGSPSLTTEWTITRYGSYATRAYGGWVVGADGKIVYSSVEFKYAVRPVYYLTSNVTLIGEGTETSPFIITSKN